MIPGDAAPIIHFDHVTVVRNGQPVIEDIHFRLRAGQFVGLVGPNGAGKTTLLRALLGLVRVESGRIEVFGRAPTDRSSGATGIGYVPQRQAVPRNFPAAVKDVVAMGRLRRLPRWQRDDSDRGDVGLALERVGIAHLASRPVGHLSGGEQRRVVLAQALCATARLLVLDEPTTGLDLPAEHAFYALLRRLRDLYDLTILAVSHDLVALAGEADELMCVNRTLHVHGNPETVIHSHAIREAYDCEFDFLAGELAHHERVGGED